MADEYSYTNHQKLGPYHNRKNASKCPTHFLYKVMAILIFLAVLPLLPSQVPDFINQTLLTGSWELLHLLFVGIAVSYGLFSRRNDENEKESPASTIDNPQSYVSKFLQVSSVFDEEVESPSSLDENKVQTWSSLYHGNEPVVVLAEEHPSTTRVGEKPLLLPVRSLKSRVLDPDIVDSSGFESKPISGSNLKVSSKRFSEKLIERKNEVVYDEDVLQSPIPRRSTSGRMDMKKEVNGPSMDESQAKAAEDMIMVRKKTLYKSPPPPPPPPPPLASNQSNFNFNNNGVSSKPINPDSGMEIKRKNRGDEFGGKSVRTLREAAIGGSQGMKKAETEEEEGEEFVEKVAMESEEEEPDTEEDEDEEEEEMDKRIIENQNKGSLMQRGKNGGIAEKKKSASKSESAGGGGDVDKQADEFIAKFREQIRLQRIESIKRSSSQLRKNTSK